MKDNKGLVTVAGAISLLSIGVLFATNCYWAVGTVQDENITDCSGLATNEIKTCQYRHYVPEYEYCYEKTNRTGYNCISQTIDAPFYKVVNGTCTYSEPRCNGGTATDDWGTNQVSAKKEYYACQEGG
jgi:hypothetical protein